jgi:hypothetical protein
MKHKTMLFRSGIILFYFSEWAYYIVNELVVKGTPRVGHPAKEGLRRFVTLLRRYLTEYPEWVIQQKRD